MTRDQAHAAAQTLLEARRTMRPAAGWPEGLVPASIDDGYAIQAAFAEAWGQPIAGWKVACTARDQQEMVGVDHPFCGRVFASYVFDSPARVEAARFHRTGLETEFAFRMARDLPPRDEPYERDEVAGAVAALHPALEIVSPRWTEWLSMGATGILADCAANGGAVLGPAVTDWQGRDLAAQDVALAFDGAVIARGKGERVLGHPLVSLTWIANELAARTGGLRAGEIVLTGTCTGLNWIEPGVPARADFGPLGSVEVVFE